MGSRLVALGLMLLTAVLAPTSAWAQIGSIDGASGAGASGRMSSGGMRPATRPPLRPRPPIHRPRPPVVQPFFPCCADLSYFPEDPPPAYAPPPPTIIYVVPTPPSLVYIPTPRVEPAPEVTGPKGTWARHGNGKE